MVYSVSETEYGKSADFKRAKISAANARHFLLKQYRLNGWTLMADAMALEIKNGEYDDFPKANIPKRKILKPSYNWREKKAEETKKDSRGRNRKAQRSKDVPEDVVQYIVNKYNSTWGMNNKSTKRHTLPQMKQELADIGFSVSEDRISQWAREEREKNNKGVQNV